MTPSTLARGPSTPSATTAQATPRAGTVAAGAPSAAPDAADAFATLLGLLLPGGDLPADAGPGTAVLEPAAMISTDESPSTEAAAQGIASADAPVQGAMPIPVALPPAALQATPLAPRGAAAAGPRLETEAATPPTAARTEPGPERRAAQPGRTATDAAALPAGAPSESSKATAAGASPAPATFTALLQELQPARERPSQRGVEGALPTPTLTAFPATPAATAPAETVHRAEITSQPLDHAFGGDLAGEVRVMLDQGVQSAEIHLNPADLGPIRIELSLSGQNADISFVAVHDTTRHGIEESLPALREMLSGQGLQLGHAGVSAGGGQQHDPGAQQHAGPSPTGRPGAGGGDPAEAPRAARTLRAARGLLDLYA